MTPADAERHAKALQEHAGENWRVTMQRSPDTDAWEVTVSPVQYACFIVDQDMESHAHNAHDLWKILEGQLDMARETIVEALGETLPR